MHIYALTPCAISAPFPPVPPPHSSQFPCVDIFYFLQGKLIGITGEK